MDAIRSCNPHCQCGLAQAVSLRYGYAVASDYFPTGARGIISAGNIGHLIAQEIDRAEFIRKRVGIGTRRDDQ